MRKKTTEKMKKRKAFMNGLCIGCFIVVLAAGVVLGLFLPNLRPASSDYEKRELTKFPAFSVESFLDGSYTSKIETWFADTFPFRDQFLQAGQSMKNLYGLKSDSVQHIAGGDDIPDDFSFDPYSEPEEESSPSGGPSSEDPTREPGSASESEATTAPEPTEPSTEWSDNGDDIAKMNPQEAGSVNIKDLVGYCVYGFNKKATNQYCEAVASLANALKNDGVKVYQMLIPNNSAIVLDEETQKAWNLSDERKVIAYYNANTNSRTNNVITMDIFDALYERRNEYLYFKTDHHWTQRAAYYAYCEFCKAAGFTAHDLSEYNYVDSGPFLGSYYSSSGFTQLEANPDNVYSYQPITTNEVMIYDSAIDKVRKTQLVRDMSSYSIGLKYMGYISGDCAYEYCENPAVKNGRKCIVVKESFGNPFVPFLVDHFEKVFVVDYRGYKESIVNLARSEGYTDIIFVNNLEAIGDLHTMQVLDSLCH